MTLFIIMMMFFREELRQVAELLGDEKRDGTCRVMTIGGLFMMLMVLMVMTMLMVLMVLMVMYDV